MKIISKIVLMAAILLQTACESVQTKNTFSAEHISKQTASQLADEDIPAPIEIVPPVPQPQPQKASTIHTAIVSNVPVKELLFTLAREAKLNLDIDADVDGLVTINAIDQPLEALLDRIVESTDLIYEIKNGVLRVKRDKPYIVNYRIDYMNMSRSSDSKSTVSTQIQSTGQGAGSDTGSSSGNNSSTEVKNSSSNTFWDTLRSNVAAIIGQPPSAGQNYAQAGTGEADASASPAQESGDIIINKESGVMAVRATRKQHAEIEKFINEVQFSTRRQVLIEATIAEVKLNDTYQAGIDWSVLRDSVDETKMVAQTLTDLSLFDRPTFNIQVDRDTGDETLQGTLSALQTFGDVKIMSSPKIMTLNNQTALLKVVDNVVYFTVDVNIETSSSTTSGNIVTYETEVNTVPVGFVMSVTPFISENNSVTLNIRPTISRVIDKAQDPNPDLAKVGVISEIPVIQVREVESILKVESGDIAVMGGLMQDVVNNRSRGVPGLSRIPYLGQLFRYDDDTTEKTELVIFIRPVVINRASIETDLQRFKSLLPDTGR